MTCVSATSYLIGRLLYTSVWGPPPERTLCGEGLPRGESSVRCRGDSRGPDGLVARVNALFLFRAK